MPIVNSSAPDLSISYYVVLAHAAVQLAIDLSCGREMPGGLRRKKPFMRHQEVGNGFLCNWGVALLDTYEDRGSAERSDTVHISTSQWQFEEAFSTGIYVRLPE